MLRQISQKQKIILAVAIIVILVIIGIVIFIFSFTKDEGTSIDLNQILNKINSQETREKIKRNIL